MNPLTLPTGMHRRLSLLAVTVAALAVWAVPTTGQATDPLPPALVTMVETERAFAARAVVVGWKAAFLEYFAESAVGYDDGTVGLAKEQISQSPDPPPDLQLLWDPRVGDVSRSGELGYLVGPSRNIRPSRNGGLPRHGAYASMWKRQGDGTFKVILDLGVPTPSAPAFPAAFGRAPHANRFTGDYDDRTPPLGTADGVLNSDLKLNAVRGYRGRLAPEARFHRPGQLPVVGEAAALRWLATQPRLREADSRFSESAQSGDLGYTWGTWSRRPAAARGRAVAGRGPAAPAGAGRAAAPPDEIGFYFRVWVRERTGQWKVALDVLN